MYSYLRQVTKADPWINEMAAKELKELVARKNEIESEICALQDVLQSHGTNMKDDLVDENGFPKPDLDIITIRKTRVRIIYLQNDLKQLMKKIEEGLHTVHAKAARQNKSEEKESSLDEKFAVLEQDLKPFLKVDAVTKGSPAEKAGLQVNDLITHFGTITVSNYTDLQLIGSVVQHSKGQELSIGIKRDEERKKVKLIPNEWAGRGLLGCNVIPVKREDKIP